MSEKTVNYTPEMEARMLAVYNEDSSQENRDAAVTQLAEELGKTRRSVIAKLSRMKVYKAKEYKTKQGEKPVSKAALVAQIATLTNSPEDVVGSLEKATKKALTILVDSLSPVEG